MSHSHGRILLSALAILFLTGMGSVCPAQDDLAGRIDHALGSSRERNAVEQLVKLRHQVLPHLIERLQESRSRDASAPSKVARKAVRREQRILETALSRFWHADVSAALVAHLDRAKDRVPVLWVIGRVGSPRDLKLVFEIAAKVPEHHLKAPLLRVELVGAMTSLLRRHPKAFAELRKQIHGVSRHLQALAIESVCQIKTPRSVRFLTQTLGHDRRIDGQIARKLGTLARQTGTIVDASAIDKVEALVKDSRTDNRLAGAICLGTLGRHFIVPELIELLEDESSRIRRAAHHALKEISGRNASASYSLWSAWYTLESKWMEETSPAVLEGLESRKKGEVMAALGACADHPLFGEILSGPVSDLLGHDDPLVRLKACAALGSLRSLHAIKALQDARHDEDTRVRRAAQGALDQIKRARSY